MSRPPGVPSLIAVALAAISLGAFTSAYAKDPAADATADPAAWALPDPAVSVVFRGADALADLLDDTERRYGRSQRVQQVAATLRGWRPEGIAPAAREWGPGLALGRGIGVFVGADDRVRVVIGATDADTARRTLAERAKQAALEITATPDGFVLPTHRLTCAGRGGLLVCDSVAVPDTAPGLPAGTDATRWLDVHVGPQAIAMSGSGLPLEWMRLAVDVTPDAIRLRYEGEIAPHARQVLAVFGDTRGESRGLGTIDARSPLVLKFSLDPAALFALLGDIEASLDPPSTALWSGLRREWNGDVVLSFAPGPLQPVLAIGLIDGQTGTGIIDGLVTALSDTGTEGARAIDQGGVLRLTGPYDGKTYGIAVRHRVLDGALVFALADADLDRLAAKRIQSPMLPPDFGARGTQGLWASSISGAFGPMPLGVLTLPEPGLVALAELAWIQLARLDSAAWVLRLVGNTATAEVLWRLL